MHVIFFSDVHLRGPQDPQYSQLLSWLDGLQVDRVYILGDLFDFWWGYPNYIPDELRAVFDTLTRLTARGVDLCLIGGNRDFALGSIFEKEVKARVAGPHGVELDGLRFFLAHGDEAESTFGYRMISFFLRSKPFALFMALLGPRRGFSLLQKLGEGSRQKMRQAGDLIQSQRLWAQKRVEDGVDVVVLGHSHHLEEVDLQGGKLYYIGDWIRWYSYLELKDGKLQLCCLSNKKECEVQD